MKVTVSTAQTVINRLAKYRQNPTATNLSQKSIDILNELRAQWSTSSTVISRKTQKINELTANYATEVKKLKLSGTEADYTIFKGSQEGYSNLGYWAKNNSTGELFYIKFPNNGQQACNEVLAGNLYELAGIKGPKTSVIEEIIPPKNRWSSPTIKQGVANQYIAFEQNATGEFAPLLREGFAADCWLANWDALKYGNTVIANGEPLRLDVGGSLCFRAQGARRTGAQFCENVPELTTFFDSYSHSRRYLNDMTRSELITSLGKVCNIPEEKIAETVKKSKVENPEYITETLLARKNYLSKFKKLCTQTAQLPNENIEAYIRRLQARIPKTEYKIPYDKLPMSTEVRDGSLTMGQALTPSQKRLYDESYEAYLQSRKGTSFHPTASNILSEDNMLHAGDINSFSSVLDKGIVARELCKGNATRVDTQTPLCADFWDVQKRISIRDYFRRPRYNDGEKNFLPYQSQTGEWQRVNRAVVYITDKRAVNKTLMDNSISISSLKTPRGEQSILYKDNNFGGHRTYTSHRAVPIGIPANAITGVVIDKAHYSQNAISQMKQLITQKNLDIKIYDLEGNLL